MKLNSSQPVWIVVILTLALFLRLISLDTVPPGLNRDEAAIGYTAYSLLKTGRDEHGIFLPLSLKSFGDWKLPLYAYITIPFVALFNLNEFTVRLPSVLLGVATVYLTYAVTMQLFRQKSIALLGAFLVAISPWHIFFSRVASEANVAVFLVALAFYLLLQANKKFFQESKNFVRKNEDEAIFIPQSAHSGTKIQRGLAREFLLPLASILLALTLLTYHGNHIFTPLIFLAFILYFRKLFSQKPWGYVGIALFILIAGFVYTRTLFSADQTKISGLLSINDPSVVHEQIEKNRLIAGNSLLVKLLSNKYVFLGEQIVQNYLKAYSPEFLFIRGGGNAQHNIPDFGNLYLVEAPFLFLGILWLFFRKEPSSWLLLAWLLIAPLGASLTKDAPHSARQFAVFPVLALITAYGMTELVKQAKKNKFFIPLAITVCFLFLVNFALFYNRYFVLFPYKSYSAWGKGYKEMVTKLARYKNQFSYISVGRPDYSPYIYYVFYAQSDPKVFQTTVRYYPETSEGFTHVQSFDGITYAKNNWTHELLIPKRLYIDWAEGVPSGATNSATLITPLELAQLEQVEGNPQLQLGDVVNSQIIDQVNLPDGSPLFYFIATDVETAPANHVFL